MSNKFKRRMRALAEKAGVSYAGAVNISRRGIPKLLEGRRLVVRSLGPAEIVCAYRPDNFVVRFDSGEMRKVLRKDFVRLLPDPDKSRCVSNLFMEVDIPFGTVALFDKTPGVVGYVISEDGESITAVLKPRRLYVPLFLAYQELWDDDGRLLGFDASYTRKALVERMSAILMSPFYGESYVDDGYLKVSLEDAPAAIEARLGAPPVWYVVEGEDVFRTSIPDSPCRFTCGTKEQPGVLCKKDPVSYGIYFPYEYSVAVDCRILP